MIDTRKIKKKIDNLLKKAVNSIHLKGVKMKITDQTDNETIKKQLGKIVDSHILENSERIRGLFIGFWNPEFANSNSETTPAIMRVKFPFNLVTSGGVRIPVDHFVVDENE